MKNFKFEPINLEADKPQIEAWDTLYRGTPEYESIRHFILEDDIIFGLGELIAGTLAANTPAPVEHVAINDKFGQSGTPAALMKAYGLDAENIVKAAKKAISRK